MNTIDALAAAILSGALGILTVDAGLRVKVHLSVPPLR